MPLPPLPMNRRRFLATTSTATGTLLAPSLLRAADHPRPIKAGFLGVAHSHAAEKWRLVRSSPHFELLALAEDDPSLRDRYQAQGATLVSPEVLIATCDVVFVESPVADHGRHGRQVLSEGKHLHLEKPPSDNLADVEEMTRLAREKDRILQVGYMWRHHPGFHAIQEAVREGWLGDVFLVRGQIGNQLAADRRPEWAAFKGGGLFELGAHLVDALIRLLGEPRAVTPFLRRHGRFTDNLMDNNVAVFDFPHATGIIQNSNLQPNSGRQRVFEVLGTNGTATLRPIEPPTLELDLLAPAGPYQAGLQKVPLPRYERYVGDIEELAAAIRRERPLNVTLDQELLVQKWLLQACSMPLTPTPAPPSGNPQ